jgi:Negative regulator of beta-lactamase expression
MSPKAAVIQRHSPNSDSRDGTAVDMLVLHYTGMRSTSEALARLLDPEAKVSAHYLVEEDGTVHSLVGESQRAWHAGVSSWRGAADINARSIGVEIVNPGHEFGYRPFPEAQVHAVIRLCLGILSRHSIPARNVVGHSDIAPTRKEDPGELFPWEYLKSYGIGLWPFDGTERADLPPTQVLEMLASFGYDLTAPAAAVAAFQRHFRPERVDGLADYETTGRLSRLLQTR